MPVAKDTLRLSDRPTTDTNPKFRELIHRLRSPEPRHGKIGDKGQSKWGTSPAETSLRCDFSRITFGLISDVEFNSVKTSISMT